MLVAKQFIVERVCAFFPGWLQPNSGGRRHSELGEQLDHKRGHLSNDFKGRIQKQRSVFFSDESCVSTRTQRLAPLGVGATILCERGSVDVLNYPGTVQLGNDSIPFFKCFFILGDFGWRLWHVLVEVVLRSIQLVKRFLARVSVHFVNSEGEWFSSCAHNFFKISILFFVTALRIALGQNSMTSHTQRKEYGLSFGEKIQFLASLFSRRGPLNASRKADSITRAHKFLSGILTAIASLPSESFILCIVLRLVGKKFYQFFDSSGAVW